MSSQPERPNILLIHADQHRWDCLGAYGHRQIKTPHLDRLAADAVRFDNSFCPYPVCTPSRYSLLSGLYVRQHGGWSNRSTLAPGIATFPRLLRDAGYRTKAIGKMHFTPTYLDVGFSEMALSEQDGDGRMDDDYHRELRAHDLVDADDIIDQRGEFRKRAPKSYWETCGAKTSNLPEAWHSTTWIGDRAVKTLETWTDSGNLVMTGFIKPHHPFDPPEPWDRMYDPQDMDLPPGWLDAVPGEDRRFHRGYFPNDELTESVMRLVTAYYYATISHIDHQVGRMIGLLERRDLYDKTLIVYTADHGELLGFHHMLLKGGPLYDPLAKVPLLIKFPGNRDGGAVRENLVNNIDVAPTLLRQAGVDVPADMAGLDLADASADREMVFSEDRLGRMVMARSRRHKLLLPSGRGKGLFYDLQTDPLEMTNRIDDPSYGSVINEHRRAIADWTMATVPPTYVDERSRCVGQDEGPNPYEDGRRQMLAYFERKVTEYLGAEAKR